MIFNNIKDSREFDRDINDGYCEKKVFYETKKGSLLNLFWTTEIKIFREDFIANLFTKKKTRLRTKSFVSNLFTNLEKGFVPTITSILLYLCTYSYTLAPTPLDLYPYGSISLCLYPYNYICMPIPSWLNSFTCILK